MGRLVPFIIQQNFCIVLHIADHYGSTDLHLGRVRLGILHRKVQAVLFFSGSIHQGFSRHVDRAVRRLRVPRLRGRNNDILPESDISIICVGYNAYTGTKAKGRSIRCVVTALIGAFHLVLDVLNAVFSIFGLIAIGIYRGIFDYLGGVFRLLLALFLVLGFFRIGFVFLGISSCIVLVLLVSSCRCSILTLVGIRCRFHRIVYRHFQSDNIVLGLDIHSACRNGAV